MFLFKSPSVWFAFLETESIWGVQERLSEIVTPRYLAEGSDSKPVPWSMYLVWMGHLALVICRTWHLDGLKLMSHHFSHISRMWRSFCRVIDSPSELIAGYNVYGHIICKMPNSGLDLVSRSFIYARKNMDPRTEPCGTQEDTAIKSDWVPVLSGVPQGTVLGPVLFSLYINDITTDIDSEIRLFADDCVCYREIKGTEDTVKLQEDIDRLGCWARKWGMRFQPVKCNIMQITRKRIKKINASYNLEGTVLENVENIKYLGVTITNDLKWNTHVSNICTKANRTLGFLRRNLSACPQDVKESAYKGLVRPVLEYGSSVWDPSSILLQEELEKVQKRAARFVTGNYIYETGSMTGILEQLKWESLKKRRRDSRIIMLYKGLKGAASIPTNDLVPPIRHVRNHHSLAFQTPFANTDIYKCSFFPQTIRDWNSLTDTLLSAAEGAEDSIAKFTSLVRARD